MLVHEELVEVPHEVVAGPDAATATLVRWQVLLDVPVCRTTSLWWMPSNAHTYTDTHTHPQM